MSPEFIIDTGRKALEMVIILAMPMLGLSLIVGILVSLVQASTQIHEATMTFVPKILAVALAMLIFFPWMLTTIVNYTTNLYMNIPLYIK